MVGMAKKSVSARIPPHVADGLDEYMETWDLNRTEAISVLLEYALTDPPNPRDVGDMGEVNPTEGVYTVELEPENIELIEDADVSASEAVNNLLNFHGEVW